uniref:Uncharacterized protein n=1 Tax=Mola mola TaxID=94237 RepID=A0A3Q3WG64_MOLML
SIYHILHILGKIRNELIKNKKSTVASLDEERAFDSICLDFSKGSIPLFFFLTNLQNFFVHICCVCIVAKGVIIFKTEKLKLY